MKIKDFEIELALNVTRLKALCEKYELLSSVSVGEYRDYMNHLEDSCIDIGNDYIYNIVKYIVKNSDILMPLPESWVLEHVLNNCIKYSVKGDK